jgi:hypothetical protein
MIAHEHTIPQTTNLGVRSSNLSGRARTPIKSFIQKHYALGQVTTRGRNHVVEQEAPFDADEVITKASEWADRLENTGLPKGWSRTP